MHYMNLFAVNLARSLARLPAIFLFFSEIILKGKIMLLFSFMQEAYPGVLYICTTNSADTELKADRTKLPGEAMCNRLNSDQARVTHTYLDLFSGNYVNIFTLKHKMFL